MHEILISQRAIPSGTRDSGFSCSYYILVDELSLACFFCESYGVKVASSDGETASVPGITASCDRILALVELLVRNTVTPCTLRDVIDDWL